MCWPWYDERRPAIGWASGRNQKRIFMCERHFRQAVDSGNALEFEEFERPKLDRRGLRMVGDR